jgi:hypothetical protein
MADAILDSIFHDVHKFELKGDLLRKKIKMALTSNFTFNSR